MKILNLFFGFSLLCIASSALADDEFITGFEDLPLMAGLSEQPDGFTSFDSPSGRFIQTLLRADENILPDSIRLFYSENLTSLGWQKDKNDCYKRDDEKLCVKVLDSQPVFVNIELRSVSQ